MIGFCRWFVCNLVVVVVVELPRVIVFAGSMRFWV